MNPIPLPSQVHYELLLQLLERQSLRAADREPALQEQIQQLIIILRKAFAKQKYIEDICQQTRIPVEYSWSMHSVEKPSVEKQGMDNANSALNGIRPTPLQEI